MNCYQVYLDSPDEFPIDWLDQTRARLLEKWTTTTKHQPNATVGTWACEIATGCRTCNEHLSLPCSLLSEANEIALFLSSSCFTNDAPIFLRLYLIILSEFAAQLECASDLMKLGLRKKPKLVCLWANRWSKHRLQILLQHHPLMAFADQYDKKWTVANSRFRTEPMRDACGNTRPVQVIDTVWFEQHPGNRPNYSDANGPAQAIILVPPLLDFLDETIQYFREFVDKCLEDPGKIRRFESGYYARNC
jgi:hypothetical protein